MALPQVRTGRRLNFAPPHLRQHLGRSRQRACAHGRDAGQPLRCNLRSAHGPWLGPPAEPRRAMGECWSARSARKRPAPRSRCPHAVRCAPSAGSCDRAAGRARPPIDRRRPARDATPAPPPRRGTASRPCARRNPPVLLIRSAGRRNVCLVRIGVTSACRRPCRAKSAGRPRPSSAASFAGAGVRRRLLRSARTR